MPTDSTSPSTTNNERFENGGNPYFLHQSDNPNLILVSKPLTGDNYSSWRRSMTVALSAKNKTGFVDGSIARPEIDSDLFPSWNRANHMVLSWLLNSTSSEIASSVIYHETAHDVWQDLHDRFQQSNHPRIFQLKQSLSDLSQGTLSVTAYFTKLKTLWEELNAMRPTCVCSCGGVRVLIQEHQDDYVMHFLMGLNESFYQIRSQILSMDPLPPINKCFNLVIREEKQKSLIPNPVVSDPILAARSVNEPIPAAKAVTETVNLVSTSRSKPKCTYYKFIGHTRDKCFKLNGYPPGHPRAKSDLNSSSNIAVNQVVASNNSSEAFTPMQLQQLMNLLSNQMKPVNINAASTSISDDM